MSWNAILLAVSLVSSTGVDFDTQVVPLLTKAGCNAAACHGAAAGRGGLKLSLFGGDPAWDYDEIVRRWEGRRVNFAHPAASLVIAKPTEQVAHEGGTRWDFEGSEARLLEQWIAEGAPRLRERQFVRFHVTSPPSRLRLNETWSLRVHALFDSEPERDVTALAVYESSDPTALQVDELGRVSMLRRGRQVVTIRFLSEVQAIPFIVPLADDEIDLSSLPRANGIDDEVLQSLEVLGLRPAPRADDATLLRRLTLHLTGRLPTSEAVCAYVADADPHKFTRVVEELLASDAYVEFWTYRLAKLLRIRHTDSAATQVFFDWVRQHVAADTPWDAMARELLLAEGDTQSYGPANFYAMFGGNARAQAEYVSELLLGVRLSCANCHNHPLDRWTQDDYHGLAAIFARVEAGRNVRWLGRGEVIHPATGVAAVARIPGTRFLADADDGRRELAQWLTARDNPYLARAMVNRLWKELLGRGLIEPTDDLRATNPATHSALLARLAEEFIADGYSIRQTIRRIVSSETYARSNLPPKSQILDDQFYSQALTTPLEAEVLLDAIADVTGVPEPYGQQPLGTRAISLVTPPESDALEILGRCDRVGSCENRTATASGLTAKLHLMNGPLLNRRIIDKQGRLRKLLDAGTPTDQVIEAFYVLALGRFPRAEEAEYWQTEMRDATSEKSAMWEDFVWSLLNSREFLTNH